MFVGQKKVKHTFLAMLVGNTMYSNSISELHILNDGRFWKGTAQKWVRRHLDIIIKIIIIKIIIIIIIPLVISNISVCVWSSYYSLIKYIYIYQIILLYSYIYISGWRTNENTETCNVIETTRNNVGKTIINHPPNHHK